MRTLPILLLTLCLSASAAIKRPEPLLSPKHASQPKTRLMTRTATEPPRLPMEAFHRKVQSEYGTDEFTAQAFQPAQQAVQFYMTPDCAPNSKVPVAWFPPLQNPSSVIYGLTTYSDKIYIAAEAAPVALAGKLAVAPAGFTRLSATGPAIWINPEVKGSFARRGVP